MLASACVLAFLVVAPGSTLNLPPLSLRGLAAVQIDAVIEKPAVTPLLETRPAQNIVVRAGQTVSSIATAYSADAAAIRWANGLLGESQPTPGTALLVPPGPGALVRVRAGETPTAFAQRVGLDPATILDYNALSSDNPLTAGSYLQVPYGAAPAGALIASRFVPAQPGVPAVPSNHGTDTFPYGQCTWYVATRRDVSWGGNAWAWYAAAAGIRPEGHVAVEGAIAVFDTGWAGHVAYVEHVNPDGSFVVSEMNFYGNGGGWGRIDRRTIPADARWILGFIY